MSDATEIPSGTVSLTLGDSAWGMDLVGTLERIQAERKRIVKEAAAKAEEPDIFAHLAAVGEMVKAAGGPELNKTQLEWLEEHLALTWAKKKSERNAEMLDVQRSQSSSE